MGDWGDDVTASIRISRNLDLAFCLDAERIKGIWEIVSQNTKNPKIVLGCSDGSNIETTELSYVLDFDNTQHRKIEYLELFGSNSSEIANIRSIDVRYGGEGVVRYNLSGDPDATHLIERRLASQIELSKADFANFVLPRYKAIAIKSLFWIIGIVLLFIGGYHVFYYTNPKTSEFGRSLWWWMLAIGWVMNTAAVYWGNIFGSLFPRSTFLIGGGIQRHRIITNRRTLVVVAVIVAIFVGIFVNWITSLVL